MRFRITRRDLIVVPGKFCLAALLMAVQLAQPAAAASDPQEVVRGFYSVLLSNMRDGRVLGESGRLARLGPVVERTFDIPAMARLAVGPMWANLNPAQQQQLIAAFGHVVETKIVKSKGDATRLDYLMRPDQGNRRISDVYLDGSISQLAVHRSEFHSILQREGVEGLVTALNRKADLLRNVAKAP